MEVSTARFCLVEYCILHTRNCDRTHNLLSVIKIYEGLRVSLMDSSRILPQRVPEVPVVASAPPPPTAPSLKVTVE